MSARRNMMRHTTLPISRPKPEWRFDEAAMEHRIAERSRRVQQAALRVQVAIALAFLVGIVIGLPIMGKNIAAGFSPAQAEERP